MPPASLRPDKTATIIVMNKQQKGLISQLFKLILFCGCLLGFTMGSFGVQVGQSGQKTSGGNSVLWLSQSESRAEAIAAGSENMVSNGSKDLPTSPANDIVAAQETEFALFALG